MTSAVIAGRNEVCPHHWGDARAPLVSKPPNPNPRRGRPGPNPTRCIPRQPQPQPRAAPAPAPAADPELSPSGHVKIRASSLSRREARQLRARLTFELGRVRALLSRIGAWEDQRRPLRHAEPPPLLLAEMRDRCAQILTRLRKQRISVWFNSPVDVQRLKLHDYHSVIRNPMDLGTVKDNLAAGRYRSHELFADDVRLTFNNALLYNPVGHQVYRFAGMLLATFEELYREAVSWFEQECEHLFEPMPVKLLPLQPLVPVPVQSPHMPTLLLEPPRTGVGKRPKPKAREPNKREMSDEEKHTLRLEIENLPEEKMANVLQIVQKRSADPALMGDVAELYFDEMDVETLWELDRFVVNWKRVLKKSQRNAVMNVDAAVAPVVPIEDDFVMMNVDPPTVDDIGESETDVLKRAADTEMVDEYVDIGDEMPTANYQSVEIEKDDQVASSSSGSGSSSSSSSDSGSRSSGDSDSDGDDALFPD